MRTLTREQREALKRVYDRCPLNINGDRINPGDPWTPITYRQFREKAQPELCGYGAIMIHWCGMWLGIEKDGYTHS